jgi:hypothetical protein
MNDFLLGLLTALIGWFLVAVALRPRLSWQPELRRFDASDDAVWHYAYIRNRMPWQAVDVNVMGRLRVKGAYDRHPERWATFDLVVDDPVVPILRGTIKSRITGANRLRIILTGSARQGFRILMDELPPRLQELLRNSEDARPDLERLLSLGHQSQLYFVAFATDGISGTRSAYESKRYTLASLPRAASNDAEDA